MKSLLAIAVLALGLAQATAAHAAQWPEQPVRLVVNFAPGGAADRLARIVGNPLQEALGQPVVIENKGGAGGNLGGDFVAKATPDGYTFLMSSGGMVSINPHLYPGMSFDPAKDLVPVASVATGFPAGLTPFRERIAEIRYAVGEGAEEIDIVITRAHALTGNWTALYDEIAQMREACGPAHMKAILATGELKTLTNVYRASMVAMMAGADFIKTSTGMEAVNATLPVSLVMVRALRDYLGLAGHKVGFKPAGGIRAAKDALAWMILMKEEAGRDWLEPDLFRFGASALLGDIERQLEHFVTGRYSAADRHGMA